MKLGVNFQCNYCLLITCSGGSILSTRCSETYETKTALMSLFGLPLWYFSQSPRVVIQVRFSIGEQFLIKLVKVYLRVFVFIYLFFENYSPCVH